MDITYPASLPVSARRDDIMKAVRENQVVIVAGETGSGKTTQLPKMLLELGLAEPGPDGRPRIIGHTQPRRIAARSVAERIAEELGEKLGETVGYQVRFTDESSRATRVKLMTDGILLAEIQHDPLLTKYGAIIVDEAHERSLNIDFLLGYLRRIMPQRPDLKIVITSATIDPERFAAHFAAGAAETAAEESGGSSSGSGGDDGPALAPIIEVSGRTFPVEIRYRPLEAAADEELDDELEDDRDPLDGVRDAVDELSKEAPGDILVFFSGEREIREAAQMLEGHIERNRRLTGTQVLPLYGRLSLEEQSRIFKPSGRPRIVLATNVAETSLTVPGIKYVIDTGTARISRYSPRTKVQRLPIERISQASARQRSGRSGRVSDGIAIRLYSEEDFESRPEYTDPEILRTNLASVILQMASIGVAREAKEVAAFPFVQPPASRAVSDGVALLTELGALEKNGTLTPLGRKLSRIPLDPRLARMVLEAESRGALQEVVVLTAALTIQDPRERPSQDEGAKERAATLHKRFADDKSDFIGFLNLWVYLQEKQAELSSSAFRRLCKAEHINYLRVREWQELVTQLRRVLKQIRIPVPSSAVDPAGREDTIHQSLLVGLLGQIGAYDDAKREYAGARGIRFNVFPGSALFKKKPEFVMAAELVETSRLWARTVAAIDPAWVELVAPHLVKRQYSEPHWSRKQGAVMAYEKVTLFGVTLVSQRRVNYSRVDPALARELFIRHALVEGDWQTRHAFFHHNRAVLAELEDLETRTRRADLRLDDEALFEFYDARIGPKVVSERHFDSWWKQASREDPELLHLDRDSAASDAADELNIDDFPKTWPFGAVDLDLSYEFHPVAPGAAPNPADGVTVHVPVVILNQLSERPFLWLIPGLREELITALIKSLPKSERRHFVPAPDVARQALAKLTEDFSPETDDLPEALALTLRRLKGHVVDPSAFEWDKVPPHLRMTYRVLGARGQMLGESMDLAALQDELAPQVRTAVAASVDPTAMQAHLDAAKRRAPKKGQSGRGAQGTPADQGAARPQAGRKGGPGGKTASLPGPLATPAGTAAATSAARERTGLTSWPKDLDELPATVGGTSAGHAVTGYPALVDEKPASGKATAGVRIFSEREEADTAHRQGLIRLLVCTLPSPQRYVVDHLSNKERLTFSQNPHGSVAALVDDCTQAAVDKLLTRVPERLPRTKAAFDRVFDEIRAELIDTVFQVTAVVEQTLSRALTLTVAVKSPTPALAPLAADISSQLSQLVYPGFVAATGHEHLQHLPRYLQAAQVRLDRAPNAIAKDTATMTLIQDLEDAYDDAVARVPKTRAIPARLAEVRWMIEELRVSLFAPGMKTAYTVSEKRVRQALKGF
ncbi:ATP-dependent RNA helicase HrpA [Falsarthrobacter nasiphocae]|uniref:RNA helicase n=1 Tax=Falsarthrobacter nasiphocae TaxID=189863 RepID=A0AAE3YI81_9MICC|nr:ATP-dependent RNA helicase HrpA [Falsarthrobacter nasiphocae]MDR6892752.1 ATP-dependent helicase HrpA [Falsarthrobacter nasiphocae]